MSALSEFLAYINPMLFYYSVMYGIGKFFEWCFSTESVWQWSWNKVTDVFGDDVGIYSIWILNSYAYLLYWVVGGFLFLMEKYCDPKTMKSYKIQENEIQSQTTVYAVSKRTWAKILFNVIHNKLLF